MFCVEKNLSETKNNSWICLPVSEILLWLGAQFSKTMRGIHLKIPIWNRDEIPEPIFMYVLLH